MKQYLRSILLLMSIGLANCHGSTKPTVLFDKVYDVPAGGSQPLTFIKKQAIEIAGTPYPVIATITSVCDAKGCYKMSRLRVEHIGSEFGLAIKNVQDALVYTCAPTGLSTNPRFVECRIVYLNYNYPIKLMHGMGSLMVYSDGSRGYEEDALVNKKASAVGPGLEGK